MFSRSGVAKGEGAVRGGGSAPLVGKTVSVGKFHKLVGILELLNVGNLTC